MRRLAQPLLLALATVLCSSAPAAARVSVSDATATHAYLEAMVALHRAPEATESAELKAIGASKPKSRPNVPMFWLELRRTSKAKRPTSPKAKSQKRY